MSDQKPVHLVAQYMSYVEVPIQDIENKLKIKWEDVGSYHLVWGAIRIFLVDGTLLEYEDPSVKPNDYGFPYSIKESFDSKRRSDG